MSVNYTKTPKNLKFDHLNPERINENSKNLKDNKNFEILSYLLSD